MTAHADLRALAEQNKADDRATTLRNDDLLALLDENQRLREALRGVRESHAMDDECWCPAPTDDGGHQDYCLAARAALDAGTPGGET